MTTIDDIREAVRHLSPAEQFRLIRDLLSELQQQYTAAEATKPTASPGVARRVAGLDQGAYWMSDDFNAPLPDDFWLSGSDELIA